MQLRFQIMHQCFKNNIALSSVLSYLFFVLIFGLIALAIMSALELRRSKNSARALNTELALTSEAARLVDAYGKDFDAYIKATSARNPTRVRWKEYLQERTDASVYKKLRFSIGESNSISRIYHDREIYKDSEVTKESELILDQYPLRIIGSFSTDRELVELLHSLEQVAGEMIKHNGCKTKKIISPAGFELDCMYTIYNIEFKTL